MPAIVHKTTTSEFGAGLGCTLSDLTEDAYGDVVGDPAHPTLGWDITSFKANPIALWSHDNRAPIGTWQNVHVANGALRANLHMAPPGSTKLVDELRALLAAGVIKGISVGFRPTKAEPRANGGKHYLRQVLCEASLVALPANPSALLTAKALGVSRQTIEMVFKNLKEERELRSQLSTALKQAAADRRRAQALEFYVKALARVKRIDAQIAKREAASFVGQHRQHQAEIVAAFTAHARAHADPPKPKFEQQSQTWRGQKLPPLTWRGQKI